MEINVKELYEKRFQNQQSQKETVWKVLCQHFFQTYIPDTSSVLDIGAGYCEFINHIKTPNGRKIVIDINEDVKKYANPDIIVINEDILTTNKMEDSSLDVIFLSNFLEHLPNKQMILDIFKICYKLLRSGGKILILQPDIRYVGQNYWNYFDHHLPLSAPSVAEALEISGFIIDSVINKFLPYTMKSKIPTPPFLVYLYLKCPLIWKVMGKQCFISAHLDK